MARDVVGEIMITQEQITKRAERARSADHARL